MTIKIRLNLYPHEQSNRGAHKICYWRKQLVLKADVVAGILASIK
jgi:hypothetical protein